MIKGEEEFTKKNKNDDIIHSLEQFPQLNSGIDNNKKADSIDIYGNGYKSEEGGVSESEDVYILDKNWYGYTKP